MLRTRRSQASEDRVSVTAIPNHWRTCFRCVCSKAVQLGIVWSRSPSTLTRREGKSRDSETQSETCRTWSDRKGNGTGAGRGSERSDRCSHREDSLSEVRVFQDQDAERPGVEVMV